MSTVVRTVAHALITWRDGTTLRTAFCGQTVQLPADVAAHLEQFGAFTAELSPGSGSAPDEPPESTDTGDRGARSASTPGASDHDMPQPREVPAPDEALTDLDADTDTGDLGARSASTPGASDHDMPQPREVPAPDEALTDLDADTDTVVDLPERPAYVATKEAWVSYAEDLHTNTGGRYGFERAAADEINKRELIAALNEQLPTDDTEER